MNYKHIFHAGNFADVIKHLVLIINLKNMLNKEKSFSVLDCFAGSGEYDLSSINSNKTAESLLGIEKIHEFIKKKGKNELPNLLYEYISIVEKSGSKTIYPGSPLITSYYLREIDQLIATELHPEEYLKLKNLFKFYNEVSVHMTDGYQALKSFVPFNTNRGLIFIDPPFESNNEYDNIIQSLNIIKKRINSISTIIWYPIKNLEKIKLFYKNIKELGFKEIIKIDFKIKLNSLLLHDDVKNIEPSKNKMNNCGLLIINPPNIKNELIENLEFITSKIYNYEADFKLEIY